MFILKNIMVNTILCFLKGSDRQCMVVELVLLRHFFGFILYLSDLFRSAYLFSKNANSIFKIRIDYFGGVILKSVL